MKNYSYKWSLRLIGIGILTIIIFRIDVIAIKEAISQCRYVYFICAIPFFFLIILTKSMRWGIFLKTQNIILEKRYLFSSYMASFYVGAATPGRLGEFIKIFYLQEKGHAVGVSFWTTISDRIFDIIVLMVISTISIVGYMAFLRHQPLAALLILLIVVSTLIVVVINKSLLSSIISTFLTKLTPVALRKSFPEKTNGFMHFYRCLNSQVLFSACILTLCGWLVYYFQLYLISLSLGIDLSFMHVVMFLSIISLLNILPITIAGIGTRDAALIFFFKSISLPMESAIAFSTMILLMFVINSFISFLFWLKHPVHIPWRKDKNYAGFSTQVLNRSRDVESSNRI